MAKCKMLRHKGYMDFEGAIKSFGSQLAVVVAAPIPFLISLAVLSVTIWQICRWYYDGRISSLEARLSFKADEIGVLRAMLPKPDNAEASGSIIDGIAKSVADKHIAERQIALKKMAKVLNEAEAEQSISRGRFSNRNVPALRSSILTAESLFGIVFPYPAPENHGGPLTLSAGIILLSQILPLLEDGHIEEAKRISQKLYDDEKGRMARITESLA